MRPLKHALFALAYLLLFCVAPTRAADNSLVSLNIPLLSETGQPAHKSKTPPTHITMDRRGRNREEAE